MKNHFNSFLLFMFSVLLFNIPVAQGQQKETYAEKLGWKKGDRVLILHVDDAGMSRESNQGAIMAIEKGVATSMSVMMPCPWVPEIVHYLKEHPEVDAGIHLTVTSEWKDYRWGPLAGKKRVPGLTDSEGCMWRSGKEVRNHASGTEVKKEIKAQIDRAISMGFNPTHLDSHMGVLFSKITYLKHYLLTGVNEHIPVMFPAGHSSLIIEQFNEEVIKQLQAKNKWKEGQTLKEHKAIKLARFIGKKLWNEGLPVLDDLHNISYDWNPPEEITKSDEKLQQWYVQKYMESLRKVKPGVTMVIMHCTQPGDTFKYISSSEAKRKGDLLAMMSPEFKQFLKNEGFILTTWRELQNRRDKVE
jgi:predicted glycoside hydrolase/deacetylase ChbG (UPF0249 family)